MTHQRPICCLLSHLQVVDGSADSRTAVDVNGTAVPFETDMFAGSMTMHFRGLPSTQASVFAGKRRTLHWVIQVSGARYT